MSQIFDFFSLILPETGTGFIVEIGDKGVKSHRPIDYGKQKNLLCAENKSNPLHVYFSVGTFKSGCGDTVPKRKQAFSDRLRALFFDIDCGENKPYRSKTEALEALQDFCLSTDTPKPTALIDSGRGVHAYWAFVEGIPAEQWQPIANGFKQKALASGLMIDPTCTADAARIMRLPGSINHKATPPKEVSILGLAQENVYSWEQFKPSPFTDTSVNDELISRTGEPREAFLEEAVKSCALLAKVHEDGGAWCSEPTWKAVLQVAWFAKDGEEWAHKLSNKHAEYSAEATKRKFNERANSPGPALCTQLYECALTDGVNLCAQCKHKGTIKSPLVLGVKEEPVSSALPPKGWLMLDNGMYRSIDEDLPPQRVINKKIYNVVVEECKEDDDNWEMTVSFNFWSGREFSASIPLHYFVDNKTLSTALIKNRFIASNNEVKEFKNLMVSWVEQLQQAREVRSAAQGSSEPQFGWTEGNRAFIVGHDSYSKNGEQTWRARSLGRLQGYYDASGTLEGWKEGTELFYGYPELEVPIAAAFAAPLINFTTASSAALVLMSRRSGVGKTSAMRASQAVWGDPLSTSNAMDDTWNALVKKLGVLNNLPVYWDEIRGTRNLELFSQVLFRLTQGRDKERLNSDSTFKKAHTWKTMLVCATNASLIHAVDEADKDSQAGYYRLLEYNMDHLEFKETDQNKVYQMPRLLEENYGHAGRKYARWLVHNTDTIDKMLQEKFISIKKTYNCADNERFWVSAITTLLTGAEIANEIGLTQFQLHNMKTLLVDTLLLMRQRTHAATNNVAPHNLLAIFMREHQPSRLEISEGSKTDTALYTPREGIAITHALIRNRNILRVPRDKMSQWLNLRGLTIDGFLRDAKSYGILAGEKRQSLAKVMSVPQSKEPCLEFHVGTVHIVQADAAGSVADVGAQHTKL